jgi:hypothetical protein
LGSLIGFEVDWEETTRTVIINTSPELDTFAEAA